MLYLDYLIGEDDTFVASLVEENCWKMEKMLVEEESRGVQRLNRGVESVNGIPNPEVYFMVFG